MVSSQFNCTDTSGLLHPAVVAFIAAAVLAHPDNLAAHVIGEPGLRGIAVREDEESVVAVFVCVLDGLLERGPPTADDSHVYVWNGTQFNDVTGQPVDGVITFTNWNSDLNQYVTSGYFTAAYWDAFSKNSTYYMMEVKAFANGNVTQTLSNMNGYKTRSKRNGTWGAWTEYTYASMDYVNQRAFQPTTRTIEDEGDDDVSLKPNYYVYYFPNRVSDLVLTCSYDEISVRQYHFIIQVAGTPTITIESDDGDIIWNGGSFPAWEEGKTYEVDIMVVENGHPIGVFIEIEPEE